MWHPHVPDPAILLALEHEPRRFERSARGPVAGIHATRNDAPDAVLRGQPRRECRHELTSVPEPAVWRRQPEAELDVALVIRRTVGAGVADHDPVEGHQPRERRVNPSRHPQAIYRVLVRPPVSGAHTRQVARHDRHRQLGRNGLEP